MATEIRSAVSLAPTRRSFLATSAAAGAIGLVLLAAPSYAQTVPAADAEVSVISPLPAKLRAAAEDYVQRTVFYQGEHTMTELEKVQYTAKDHTTNAVHPFRINVPEAALVDLRQRIAA